MPINVLGKRHCPSRVADSNKRGKMPPSPNQPSASPQPVPGAPVATGPAPLTAPTDPRRKPTELISVPKEHIVGDHLKGHVVVKAGDNGPEDSAYLQNFDEQFGLGDVKLDHPVIQQIVNSAVSTFQGANPGRDVYSYVFVQEGTKDFALYIAGSPVRVVAPTTR